MWKGAWPARGGGGGEGGDKGDVGTIYVGLQNRIAKRVSYASEAKVYNRTIATMHDHCPAPLLNAHPS